MNCDAGFYGSRQSLLSVFFVRILFLLFLSNHPISSQITTTFPSTAHLPPEEFTVSRPSVSNLGSPTCLYSSAFTQEAVNEGCNQDRTVCPFPSTSIQTYVSKAHVHNHEHILILVEIVDTTWNAPTISTPVKYELCVQNLLIDPVVNNSCIPFLLDAEFKEVEVDMLFATTTVEKQSSSTHGTTTTTTTNNNTNSSVGIDVAIDGSESTGSGTRSATGSTTSQSQPQERKPTNTIKLLHLWIQQIVIGSGGENDIDKVRVNGSDVYLALDTTLPAAGLGIHYDGVGRRLRVNTLCLLPDLLTSDVLSLSHNNEDGREKYRQNGSNNDDHDQRDRDYNDVMAGKAGGLVCSNNEDEIKPLGMREKNIGIGQWKHLCEKNATVSVDAHLTHSHSLQRITADFCALHRLTHVACGYLAAHLSSVVYKDLLASSLGLPAVQHMPTPQDPFVFLHIEKTAGTAFRRLLC